MRRVAAGGRGEEESGNGSGSEERASEWNGRPQAGTHREQREETDRGERVVSGAHRCVVGALR